MVKVRCNVELIKEWVEGEDGYLVVVECFWGAKV